MAPLSAARSMFSNMGATPAAPTPMGPEQPGQTRGGPASNDGSGPEATGHDAGITRRQLF
jgi:hypothetical protein